MIEILVMLLLVVIVVYVAHLVVGMLVLPQQAKTIIYLIIGLVVLFWLLQFFGLYSFPR